MPRGRARYEDSKIATPLLARSVDGTAEQAQLPGNLLRKNIGAHESKAPEGVLPVSQTSRAKRKLASRSEFPIRPVSESAGGATRSN
ncbi:DUF2138 family protein [Escherichia coli]